MGNRKCSKCGEILVDGAKYCHKCGTEQKKHLGLVVIGSVVGILSVISSVLGYSMSIYALWLLSFVPSLFSSIIGLIFLINRKVYIGFSLVSLCSGLMNILFMMGYFLFLFIGVIQGLAILYS